MFRRYDRSTGSFRGSFLNTAFELFALGVGYHFAHDNRVREDLTNAAKEVWTRGKMASGYATGKSTEARLAEFIPIGRELVRA